MFENLPIEIIFLISEFLDDRSFLNFSLTSKEHYSFTSEKLKKRKEYLLFSELSDQEILEEIKILKNRKICLEIQEYRKRIDLKVFKQDDYSDIQNGRVRIIVMNNYGRKIKIKIGEGWFLDRRWHRPEKDGPAMIDYKNGKKIYESYFLNDKRHRTDGPACIKYNENDPKKKEGESWWLNGHLYRENGPIFIYYYGDGPRKIDTWYFFDILRLKLPYKEYDENDPKGKREEYFLK